MISFKLLFLLQHFWQLLKIGKGDKTGRAGSVIAHISTRASSMKGNTLAGWYGYRASKTALNMCMSPFFPPFICSKSL